MRIWKGIEKEGAAQGEQTIFIESKYLYFFQVETIKEQAKDCRRLYFGAGKKDILGISKGFFNKFQDYQIIIETTPLNLPVIYNEIQNADIIIRIETRRNNNRLIPKIEYKNESVRIYQSYIENDIKEVLDGQYNDDIMLWEE